MQNISRFKRLINFLVFSLACVFTSSHAQSMSAKDIEKEVLQFQTFYSERFPDNTLESYNRGATALPQFSKRLEASELIDYLRPFEMDFEWLFFLLKINQMM